MLPCAEVNLTRSLRRTPNCVAVAVGISTQPSQAICVIGSAASWSQGRAGVGAWAVEEWERRVDEERVGSGPVELRLRHRDACRLGSHTDRACSRRPPYATALERRLPEFVEGRTARVIPGELLPLLPQ